MGEFTWALAATTSYNVMGFVFPMYLWQPAVGTTLPFGVRPKYTGVAGKGGCYVTTAATPHGQNTLFEWFRPGFLGTSGGTKFKLVPCIRNLLLGNGNSNDTVAYSAALSQQTATTLGPAWGANLWGYAVSSTDSPFWYTGGTANCVTAVEIGLKQEPL